MYNVLFIHAKLRLDAKIRKSDVRAKGIRVFFIKTDNIEKSRNIGYNERNKQKRDVRRFLNFSND